LKKLLLVLIVPFLSIGQIVTEDCGSTPDPGPCFGCGIIYWFNPTTSQCEESCWGLCDGLVPFWTLEDCQNSCVNNSFIKELSTNKILLKKLDFMGRETNQEGFQLHIYYDGSVQKKYLTK
tara:strand:+ start:2362 stop:2724 length:363 start_codon:yes stop_codon:yes gene_type:complete